MFWGCEKAALLPLSSTSFTRCCTRYVILHIGGVLNISVTIARTLVWMLICFISFIIIFFFSLTCRHLFLFVGMHNDILVMITNVILFIYFNLIVSDIH